MTTGPGAPGAAPGQPAAGAPGAGEPAAGSRRGAGLLDALGVAVVLLDRGGRVELWSPAAERVLGWEGAQVAGWPVGSLVVPDAGRAAVALDRVLAGLARSGSWAGVLPLRHRDGRTVTAEVRASLLGDGRRRYVLAELAEIGLLRGVEHDLAVLDAVFDTSALGIGVFDTGLRYLRVNQELARMNGRGPADHVGRTVREVFPGSTGEELAAVQRQVLSTGRSVVDLVTPGPDHRGFRSASYSRITDRGGRVLGVSVVVMDVTGRFRDSARLERARERLAVLGDVGGLPSELMDAGRRAGALAGALVPGFGDYTGVLVLPDVLAGGDLPAGPPRPGTPLVLAGFATAPGQDAVAAALRSGMEVTPPAGSVLADVLAGGPAWFAGTPEDIRAAARSGRPDAGADAGAASRPEADAEPVVAGADAGADGGGGPGADTGVEAALGRGVGSVLAVPLRARGVVLGLLVAGRAAARDPFDADDLALAYELADRAGAALDNARLYARERDGALTLQRALLPHSVPALPGVEVAHRYLPGSRGAEAGGDWFDVVQLAGGRIAFVIGDVMGHGLSAAATMGRMRTAVRTLAALDMPPDDLLRRINDVSDDFALSPGTPMMATLAYAVYDPAAGRCVIAVAGHPPPVLVRAGLSGDPYGARPLEVPANTPIGVGGGAFAAREFEVPEGAVLVLYTDGLVERRGEDITEGIDRLAAVLDRPYGSLREACDGVLTAMVPEREQDDVALLMARLGGLPQGTAAAWTFRAEPRAVREARARVRETLLAWGLAVLTDVTMLLVSELVTNALRYARGPIGLRMVRTTSLLVEVSDPLPDPPLARSASADDEGGRGLHLVARASRRWGTRPGPLGKTVWFELALPGSG